METQSVVSHQVGHDPGQLPCPQHCGHLGPDWGPDGGHLVRGGVWSSVPSQSPPTMGLEHSPLQAVAAKYVCPDFVIGAPGRTQLITSYEVLCWMVDSKG